MIATKTIANNGIEVNKDEPVGVYFTDASHAQKPVNLEDCSLLRVGKMSESNC